MTTVGQMIHLVDSRLVPEVDQIPLGDMVLAGVPDNEDADSIFAGKHWGEICIEELLHRPTSVWFLSFSSLQYFLISIVIAVAYSREVDRMAEGRDLMDHVESKIARVLSSQDLGLDSNQVELLRYGKAMADNFDLEKF